MLEIQILNEYLMWLSCYKVTHPGKKELEGMQNKVPQLMVRSDIRSGQGGYVNGVYYPDMSGTCTGTTPPPPQPPTTGGGGTVNGVYYPDMSGTCTAT